MLTTHERINAPFPGFLVLRNNLVIQPWLPHWAGFERGLQVGDVILAVDGEPVATAMDLDRIVQRRGLDAALSYTVRRGTEEFQLAIPVAPRSPRRP